MKRSITIFTIVLPLLFGMTAMAHAGWFSPLAGFNKNVDRALNKERHGNLEEAREYWAKVAELGKELLAEAPTKAEYLLGTARAYYGLGDYDRAIELYASVLANGEKFGMPNLPQSYAWIYVYLGLAYAKKGDAAKTIEYWEQVPFTIGGVYTVIQDQLAALKGA